MNTMQTGVTITRTQLEWLLRFAVAGAMIGHGAYGAVLGRASWFGYLAVLRLSESTVESTGLIGIIGGTEIALGAIALLFPVPALLLFLAAWKVFTELLRPAAGEPFWEFVERASNMVAPLALLYVRGWSPRGAFSPRYRFNPPSCPSIASRVSRKQPYFVKDTE